ncbi:MAG: hypothetical protein WAO35_16055 [Terriglobia bacterium]
MNTRLFAVCSRSWGWGGWFARLIFVICAIGGLGAAAQKPKHPGIKLEGYATLVEPDSILVFDKKNQEIKILTDKDYTSLVAIAAPVTVWYTTEGGVNHLEDIVYPSGGSFVPMNQIGEGIKRIIVLPRPEDVENTHGLISAISTYLADNAGWFVAPPELAEEIASRSKAPSTSLDAINPDTGEVNVQQYMEPQRALMTTIAEESHSDAVLEVRVIKVKAKVRASVASWDDMTEPVASRKSRVLSPLTGLEGSGWVYAATADMSLWSQNGKLLWKKRRGFALLGVQSGLSKSYHERPLTEVYADSSAMQRWLEQTLGELAPPIHGNPVGPSPISPEPRN